ncbi:hypothetical protein AOCH_005580 [Aspergillus ochraceoroseus]|uniref:Aminoglycoside phosphotransferase domain-containing protein n=1 Tax=Aspergillus ochraceoroseus TaxID=138278 RepID=A0A0F8UEB1_9EURO|nr:hypothetical protein AOCH_005580 [Aspergillus ochraceoroseus]
MADNNLHPAETTQPFSMQRELPLLHGQISLSTALVDDDNVLQELSYPDQRFEFYVYLYQSRAVIESIVSYHMNLNKKQTCHVGEVKEWMTGSFNVCILVDIDGQDDNAPKRVLIRFPLPYKVGEIQHPGNADEKLRCEAATFIWIRQNCPSIPMPRLWGFAFAQGPCFTAIQQTPVFSRLQWDLTYSTSDSYFMDMLSYHDSRLRHAPNSIRDKADGEAQLSTLTIMRALLPHFSHRDYRRGPFIMTLTDLHQSNLFVDSDWNIKSLVDLEWTCSLPVEMLHPPYWLTSRGVDQLYKGGHLDAFSEIHAEFMNVFEEEEQARSRVWGKAIGLTSIMRKGWEMGNFWYFHALETPKGLYNIFLEHIQPRFSKLDDAGMVEFERTISPYWAPDIQKFLDDKMKDKEIYEGHLRAAFTRRTINSGPPAAS